MGASLPPGLGCKSKGVCLPGTPSHMQHWALHLWPLASRLEISVPARQKNHVYWRDGGTGVGLAQSRGMSGRDSGSQEAPIHWHSGTRGHAAPVTQQEKDDVHHVLHLCGQGGRQGTGEGGCPSPFPATPHGGRHTGYRSDSPLGSRLTHQQTCQAGFDPAWSWPSGGCSNWSGPWGSSPPWGSPRSRGSTPGQAGG